jgi:alpha-tubulin suppressor-like RCC1 family protein
MKKEKALISEALSDIISISSGAFHTCALRKDSSLWCWGWNEFGQLGDRTYKNKNLADKIFPKVSKVSSGAFHTCAVMKDASLWC